MESIDKFGDSVTWSKVGNLSFVSPAFANRIVGDGDGWSTEAEKKPGLSSFSWVTTTDLVHLTRDSSWKSTPSCLNVMPNPPTPFSGFQDIDAFSSSLPTLFNEKLNLSSSVRQFVDMGVSHVHEELGDQVLSSFEELESQTIGNLLPDDEDELLAGIMEGILSNVEEPEDFDLFSSGGGLEMESDNSQERFRVFMNYHRGFDSFPDGTATHRRSINGSGSVIGEHPYGEHPSRTLFVRNVNSNVKDSELQALFEQCGAIQTLYTACKHHGFVMISYYDIRAAQSAMLAFQNKSLQSRKLDIHFSIPKDNPLDKNINQRTLVVFNLDASVTNDDLHQIFGAYGEVKEIRETPHKRYHKFIEFYDVRAAEAALRALNRSDLAGKLVKFVASRPVGVRSSMQQSSKELEQEETRGCRKQAFSPLTKTPPGHSHIWGQIGSPVQNGCLQGIHHSVGLGMGTTVPGLSEAVAGYCLPLPHYTVGRAGAIGSHLERQNSIEGSHSPGPVYQAMQSMTSYHAHSFPDYSNNVMPFYTSSASLSVQDGSLLLHGMGPLDGIEGMIVPRATNGVGGDVSLFEHAPGAGVPSTGSLVHLSSIPGEMGSLSGSQFLWGNPNNYQCTAPSSAIVWSTSAMGDAFDLARHCEPQLCCFSGTHGRFINTVLPSHLHHVGSAPLGDPPILERHMGYFGDSPDTPFLGPGSLGPISNNGNHVFGMGGSHGIMPPSFGSNGGNGGSLSSITGKMSPRPRTHMYQTAGLPVSFSGSSDVLPERGKMPRTKSNIAQTEKKQYQLDIDRILCGEDTRTTLMIKNIPNKYTSKMLLAAIDENHHGAYDFLYLPIDFKNKCNVGYAFINLTAPQHIIPFYQAFNGKKWEKFNSEKVASLAYARIQGKAALVTHFQNSSLMSEDKRCRPILFHSDGPEVGDHGSNI